MKRKTWLLPVLCGISLAACQKSNDAATTLTASTTQANVGQTVSVQLSSGKNASSWTVTPSASVAKTYAITTSKINFFTFNSAGTYTVSVRVRDINYDSTHHQSLDSCWHHGGGDAGGCKHGIDSASVSIKVI
jgi:nitrous oxide reductase accessory protein NosL